MAGESNLDLSFGEASRLEREVEAAVRLRPSSRGRERVVGRASSESKASWEGSFGALGDDFSELARAFLGAAETGLVSLKKRATSVSVSSL